MRSSILGRVPTVAATTALVLGLAACGAANESSGDGEGDGSSGLSGTLEGAGASSQDAAQAAWQAGFLDKNPDVTVNYAPIGSGGGRERFVNNASDFGGTDAALSEEELSKAEKRCGQVVEIPVYISPIAVAINLQSADGNKIDSLNIEPNTLADIFNGEITNWNAQAIADANPDVNLPDKRITPVHRSDESGTTENFVDYLSVAAGDAWPHEVSGNWPVDGGEAAKGTAGVKRAIQGGSGTIGYLDASQAGELGTIAVGVGEEFVNYSPEAAAKVVEVSEREQGQGEHVFAYDLARDTTESGTYPIVLVSYGLACANYEDAKTAELVKAYMSYMISAEGQQAAAEAAGSAPLSDGLRQKLQPALDAISASSSS